MSLADDSDFSTQVVEQTAKIIATEVGKVQSKLNAERKERQQLQNRVESLETDLEGMKRTMEQFRLQQSACVCRQTVFEALSAAAATVAPPLPQNVEQSLSGVDRIGMDFSTLFTAETSESRGQGPINSTPLPCTPMVSLKRVSTETVSTDSRKKTRAEATIQILDNLDSLPAELKQKIQPFYKVDKQATQDKLNDVQRAFVKFKAHQLYAAGGCTTAAFVEGMIKEGIDERLWQSDFNPGEFGKFDKYLLSRLKNEKKALRRRDSLQSQQQLVSRYMEESLQMNDDE